MRFWLNIIWLVFGGFVLFLDYIFFGLLACIFIVTIPAGIASFRIASYIIWPFGKRVVPMPGAGAGSALMNLIWFFIADMSSRLSSRPSPSSVFPWRSPI